MLINLLLQRPRCECTQRNTLSSLRADGGFYFSRFRCWVFHCRRLDRYRSYGMLRFVNSSGALTSRKRRRSQKRSERCLQSRSASIGHDGTFDQPGAFAGPGNFKSRRYDGRRCPTLFGLRWSGRCSPLRNAVTDRNESFTMERHSRFGLALSCFFALAKFSLWYASVSTSRWTSSWEPSGLLRSCTAARPRGTLASSRWPRLRIRSLYAGWVGILQARAVRHRYSRALDSSWWP